MIQKAKLKDLENILLLFTLNSHVYSNHELEVAEEDILESIEDQDKENEYYVSIISNKIIGCAGFSKQTDTVGVYMLHWLAVHPDFKRKGIATELYNFIEEKLKAFNARLIILNTSSGEKNNFFYEKMGFKQAGIIPNYYNKSKNLVWYYKILKN